MGRREAAPFLLGCPVTKDYALNGLSGVLRLAVQLFISSLPFLWCVRFRV